MALDVIALAAFSAPSFREALARAARYKPCAPGGENPQLYDSHFGRVRFSAPDNGLILPASDLDRPFLTHNADLLGILPLLVARLRAGRPGDRHGSRRAGRCAGPAITPFAFRLRYPKLDHDAG